MATSGQDVTLVTARRFADPADDGPAVAKVVAEDRLLGDALATLGLGSRRVAWDDPAMDWSATGVAVLRATWDYFERLDAFRAWLDRVAADTVLVNALPLVRWNLDKRYLADLRRAGLPITPTRFVASGARTSLATLLAECGWDEAVVKPAVSASGWETHRVTTAGAARFEAHFRHLLRHRDLLVQPFLPGVVTQGELSCMVVGGGFTHAVRKRARPGRFLVQAEHGGTVEDHAATDEQVALAERTVAVLPAPAAYARVDLVPGPDGEWLVGELEIIEPELWLRRHPPAAAALAGEIARALADRRGAPPQR